MDEFDEFPAEEPESGGGFLKYCLICGCLLAVIAALFVGTGVYMFSQAFTTDPAVARQKLQGVVACDIPEGYDGMFAMDFFGVTAAAIAPTGAMQGGGQNLPLMVIACSFPPGQGAAARAQIQQQIDMQLRSQGQFDIEDVQTIEILVRGEPVEMERAVGTGAGGQRIIQISGLIDRYAEGGEPIFLMLMGNEDTFDQAAMDAFLGSIK